MKTPLFFLSCILITLSNLSYGQQVKVFDKQTNPGEVLDEKRLPAPVLEGSVYLFEEWTRADIELNDNKNILDIPVKYNLQDNILEINVNGEIKICPINSLSKFTLKNTTGPSIVYYNNNLMDKDGATLTKGISRVIYDGKIIVLAHEYLVIKEANYNVALSHGQKNHKPLIKKKIYVLSSGKIVNLKSQVKDNEVIFRGHLEEVYNFSKTNRLKLKKEADIYEIFQYYNSLI